MAENGSDSSVNYDDVSRTYDQRYEDAYEPAGIASALLELAREVEAETIREWMLAGGFENVASRIGERIALSRAGRDILPLDRNFTSQLSLLSEEAYAAGIARIEAAPAKAEASGETLEFVTDAFLFMTTGRAGAM